MEMAQSPLYRHQGLCRLPRIKMESLLHKVTVRCLLISTNYIVDIPQLMRRRIRVRGQVILGSTNFYQTETIIRL
jgi:hypothetical protein